MARTVLFGWLAMIGVRLKLLCSEPGHYMVEIDAREGQPPRWRIYAIGESPGRWEQPRMKMAVGSRE